MKTLTSVLIILAAACTTDVQAQGTVLLNNYASGSGTYDGYPQPAPAGTYFEILGGLNPATWVPLVNSSGQGPVFTIEAAGVNALGPGTGSYFNVGYASVPGVAAGGSAFLAIKVWRSAPTWETALFRDERNWIQTIGTAVNPAPLLILNPPLDMFIPEPPPAALAGLALAMLGFRHWRKRSAGHCWPDRCGDRSRRILRRAGG